MKYFFLYKSPIGIIRIVENGQAITLLKFYGKHSDTHLLDAVEKETELIKETCKQLSEYFGGQRKVFDLPLQAEGTVFQKKVWNALRNIPYGETRTYKQIAVDVKCPKGARAVGMANNRNPISIIIPCHRVIGADGSLTGYAGGLDVKQKLLDIER